MEKKSFKQHSTTLYGELHFTWLMHLTIKISFASDSLSSYIRFFFPDKKNSEENFPNGKAVKIRDI